MFFSAKPRQISLIPDASDPHGQDLHASRPSLPSRQPASALGIDGRRDPAGPAAVSCRSVHPAPGGMDDA